MTAATTPDERWRLGYRPALDELRGIVVVLVIGQHADVPSFKVSGTVGVTLFFVEEPLLRRRKARGVAEPDRSARHVAAHEGSGSG